MIYVPDEEAMTYAMMRLFTIQAARYLGSK